MSVAACISRCPETTRLPVVPVGRRLEEAFEVRMKAGEAPARWKVWVQRRPETLRWAGAAAPRSLALCGARSADRVGPWVERVTGSNRHGQLGRLGFLAAISAGQRVL